MTSAVNKHVTIDMVSLVYLFAHVEPFWQPQSLINESQGSFGTTADIDPLIARVIRE